MEPLAAVGLAGNIIQFLDFTRDTISKSRQTRTFISEGYADLENLTTHLKALSGHLRSSSEPVDLVLEQLCSRCIEVAEELLEALGSLDIKGEHTRFQSLRKALKVLWGREKLRILEERLAGFRHELHLHITVELRSRFDVLEFQQTQSFQALDHTTKEGAQKILDVLQDNRDHLLVTTDAQTRQLSALHAQNEIILNRELRSAAVRLAEQSGATRNLMANEHEKSRTETLNAIADAASGYHDALSTEAENISARIEAASESTRAQVTETMDKNQAILKQQITGLQRGLSQLQLEIDRKTEELKEIVLKINTTREGPDRKCLKEMGNSATVVLMSLLELYKALQEMLEPMLHRARIAFGNLLRHRDDRSAILEHPFELEINNPQVGSSLPMYYAFYYQPLFRNYRCQRLPSEVFPSTKMESWIHRMRLAPNSPDESSSEAHALFDLARNGDELVWTMATLVAGLDACLTQEEAVLVLSTAFSLCYDPRCVLPVNETWLSDIPSRVALFFDDASATALQRPRYGLDCTLGRRLKEDYFLLLRLANKCGLQDDVSQRVDVSYEASTRPQRADLTLALVALVSQPLSWQASKVKRGTWASLDQRILFHRGSLWVDASATLVIDFLYAIQLAGVPIKINEDGTSQSPPFEDPEILDLDASSVHSWYRSEDYNRVLKTRSWWPDREDYLDWNGPPRSMQQ